MLKQNSSLRQLQSSFGTMMAKIPISPNQWTVISFLVAISAAFVIAYDNDLVAGLLLFAVAGALDLVDGAVARATGKITKLGGFIDGISDRFVEALFLFSLMFYPLPVVLIDPVIWLALAVFLGTSMPSFVRAYADHKEVMEKQKALEIGGICERSERIIILVLGLGAGLAISIEYFVYSLILVSVLSAVTIVQRITAVIRK